MNTLIHIDGNNQAANNSTLLGLACRTSFEHYSKQQEGPNQQPLETLRIQTYNFLPTIES